MSQAAEFSVPLLGSAEFERVRQLAYDHFGLELRPGKESLVTARLGKLLRQMQFSSFEEFFRYLKNDRSGEAMTSLINALTTNHTSFFREAGHFEFLTSAVIPTLAAGRRLSIWSAACSTGEEPYSIAFSLLRSAPANAMPNFHIVATDISTRVLSTARRGAYPASRFVNTPLLELRPFLLKAQQNGQEWYQVKKSVRSLIEFRRLNLMDSFSLLGTFQVIFCRNVMIYFDRVTQARLVAKLSACLDPGGYLFIGHAESLNRIQHDLEYVQPAIYRKPPSAGSDPSRGRKA